MRPEDFPLLQSLAQNGARFDEAVRILAGAVEARSIRNKGLENVKAVLGRVVESAWTRTVNEPFFYGGRYESQTKDVYDLSQSIMIMGLHSVIATSKKLAKTKAQGPAVDAMRAVIREALPLAEAVRSVKPYVVMGRAPNPNPKPVNPNKVVKTCACCFRGIAVAKTTMAHHGYERPGYGWQTASCPGTRFPPLEVSSEGLVWLIRTVKDRRGRIADLIAVSNEVQRLSVRDTGDRFVEIDRSSPRWEREHRHYVQNLQADLRMIDMELPDLEKRLAEWKPEVIPVEPATELTDTTLAVGM